EGFGAKHTVLTTDVCGCWRTLNIRCSGGSHVASAYFGIEVGPRRPDDAYMAVAERVPVLDLMALSGMDDPYPLLAELRRTSPVVKGSIPLTWAVTRHADVSALLRDDRLG